MNTRQQLIDNQESLRKIQEKLEALEVSVSRNLKTIKTLKEDVHRLMGYDPPDGNGKPKKKNNTLIVTVSNETFRIEGDSVNTFLDVIHEIGIGIVKDLGLRKCGTKDRIRDPNIPPLITTKSEVSDYPKKHYPTHWRSRCGNYLVYASGSSEAKADKLREIRVGLDIPLKIRIEHPDGRVTEY